MFALKILLIIMYRADVRELCALDSGSSQQTRLCMAVAQESIPEAWLDESESAERIRMKRKHGLPMLLKMDIKVGQNRRPIS